jgi:imidazoleglycerol phosphate synthase glutamine amidotransferase subunit HisH
MLSAGIGNTQLIQKRTTEKDEYARKKLGLIQSSFRAFSRPFVVLPAMGCDHVARSDSLNKMKMTPEPSRV